MKTHVRATIVPFAFMASAALMLVVLWERSPVLSVALVGPLLAIALYQRSTHRALRAMRLALTDPLTGLGNHRHFHERLQRELLNAEEQARPLTLCLVDIDDFKRINDRFGHPSGDRVLSQIATRLRQGGEAFRLGGDEFALLLADHDESTALTAAESIVERISTVDFDHIGQVTVSAGLATFPVQGHGRDELIRLADSALYWAKEHGKNRVRIYRPDIVELAELKRFAAGPDKAARYRAAASLAKAVDARDTYTGSHSERVAELAARVAVRLGLDAEQVELTRLAASLHDLGKLAIPEEILQKAGTLTDSERLVLRTPSADRFPDARQPGCRPHRPSRSASPRALGRCGLSRRSLRRADPARLAHHLRVRRLRRHDLRPALPTETFFTGGARRAGALRRLTVRPWHRRGLP